MFSLVAQIPRYAIYSLVIFAPLARGGVQPWAITVILMITLIALTAFIITKTWEDHFHWIKTPLDKPIIALMALCLISYIFSVHKPTSFRALILLLNYLVIFYLTIHTFRTRKDMVHLIYVIIGMAFFLSLFGLFKHFGANPFPFWEYTDLAQSTDRLASTYGNPDHLAGFMEMALPLLLGLLLLQYARTKTLLLLYITAMALTALILTLSRGAWLGITAALVFMAVCLFKDRHFHRKRLLIGICCTTLAALMVILSTTPVVERITTTAEKDTQSNLYGRIQGWKGTIDMIRDYPLTGIGLGTYVYTFTRYQPPGLGTHRTMAHNDYLHFISETGLAAVGLILFFAVVLYAKGYRKLKNPSQLVRGTTLGALAGITAIIVHSFFDFNLHIPANIIIFTVLVDIIASPNPNVAEKSP
jgi:O-antigen ligase